MIGAAPVCLDCKHFDEDSFDGFTCKAFPAGVPDEILMEGNDHTKPLPEQKNDIVFEPIEQ